MLKLHCVGVVAATTLCLSCAPSSIEIEIDRGFDRSHRARVEAMMAKWDAASTRPFEVVERAEWLILPADLRPGWLGYTQRSRRLVRIDTDASDDLFDHAVLHELGHVLELRHPCTNPDTPGETSSARPCDPDHSLGVMDPRHGDVVFSPEDIAECRRVGSC